MMGPHDPRGREALLLVIDHVPVLVSYIGADLRYRFVNVAYEHWFGRPREEVVGRTMEEVLGVAAMERLRPFVDAVLAGEPVTFERELPYREGGTRFVQGSYVPHRNADGSVEGFIVLVGDASQARRAALEREELLRLEKRARSRLAVLAHVSEVLASSLDYETTLHNVIDLALPELGDFGFFDLMDDRGEVRRISRAYRDPNRQAILDQTRWVRSERTDKNLCALSSGFSGYHPHIDRAWMEDIASSPEHLAVLEALTFRSMITVPLRYHDRLLGALTLFYADSGRHHSRADVELAEEVARRAAAAVENARLFKQAREAVRVRDDFLSIAGHELRTPLTALHLQVTAVKRLLGELRAPGAEDAVARVADRVDKVSRYLGRFGTLVDELLDISRLSAGRLTLEVARADLAEVVGEVLARSSEELGRAGCIVTATLAPAVAGRWDRLRIEQVVTNLLSNAMKYGRGKPIEVIVERDGDVARLTVRDHGIGISVDDQKRVFERYERAVSSKHFGGLGLGLWIVRQLVEAHGGTIDVTSTAGEGATFVVTLPIDEVPTIPVPDAQASPSTSRMS